MKQAKIMFEVYFKDGSIADKTTIIKVENNNNLFINAQAWKTINQIADEVFRYNAEIETVKLLKIKLED